MERRILAIGGGGFLMEDASSPIDRHIARLTGQERPKVCFISTPSGDSVEMIEKFYAAFERLDCEASHLAFFRKPFRNPVPALGIAECLLAQDAIFVGGGNTRSAMAVWREWGLDIALAEAWRHGVLLSGMSAGAMCWYEHGLTDSYWGNDLKPLRCLGLLPGGCGVHYSSEPRRRIRLHEEVIAGVSGPCVGIDDGAAILYSNETVREVVSWRPGATAYQVFAKDGTAIEHAYSARSIA